MNGKLVESVSVGDLAGGVLTVLQRYAADLMTPKLVEHYLTG
jgi:hypothetical protein